MPFPSTHRFLEVHYCICNGFKPVSTVSESLMGVRLCRRTGTYRRGSAATKGCAEDVFGRAPWVAEVAVDRWWLPTGYRTLYGQYGPVKS